MGPRGSEGGVKVMDFTNYDMPEELAVFERGPIDPPQTRVRRFR